MPVPGEVTDLGRVQTEEIRYPSEDTAIEAYVARPREAGAKPGIIVIHEAFGPVEHIRDVARRFANIGFTAIAPNLYTREGAPDPKDMNSVFPKMFGRPDAEVVRDLEAAAAYLRSQPDSNGKVGCIGFCSGGRQTLLFACSSATVDTAVDCWGGFISRATQEDQTTAARPTPIIDLSEQLHCPLYAVIGEEDENPSPTEAAELERRLKDAGKTFQVEVFIDAGHAFLADYRPSYREGPALKLWPKIVAFLETQLR